MAFKISQRDLCWFSLRPFEKGLADELYKVVPARIRLHKQNQLVRLGTIGRDCELTADDRLHAFRGAGEREFERTEQIASIGYGHCRHALLRATLSKRIDTDSAFGQRIGSMNPEMNEFRVQHGSHPKP